MQQMVRTQGTQQVCTFSDAILLQCFRNLADEQLDDVTALLLKRNMH